MKIRAAFLLVSSLLLAFSCQSPQVVNLQGDSRLWGLILGEKPLPGGYTPGNDGSVSLRIATRKLWETPEAPKPRVVLGTTYWAPVVNLWELPDKLPGRKTALAMGLVSLEDILPPQVGLPASSSGEDEEITANPLYPGNPAYPWRQEIYLSVEGDHQGLLDPWLDSLEGLLEEPVVTMTHGGDVNLDRGVDKELLTPGGVEKIFTTTLPLVRNADITAGNLEGPVTDRGTPMNKTYVFRFLPASLKPLEDSGFDVVTLANNHIMDYGQQGFDDTLAHLEASGLGWVGMGRNRAQAAQSWRLTARGKAFGFFGLADFPQERTGFNGLQAAASEDKPGLLWADEPSIKELEAGFLPGSFETVLVHGGNEYWSRPSEKQRQLYLRLAASGADLVIGSHPHVLQGLEFYRGKLIAWSLGNFVFGDFLDPGSDSAVLTLGIFRGRTTMLWLHPVRLDKLLVFLVPGKTLIREVNGLSRELAEAQEKK